jgi:type IV pilus assembly protein PilA
MNLLQAYLSDKRVRSVLAKKPSDAGFSLIELVVVVAVLAILAAIAIPQFSSINDRASVSAAKNSLATMYKECAVKLADSSAYPSPSVNIPTVTSYTISSTVTTGNNCGTASSPAGFNAVNTASAATGTASIPNFAIAGSNAAKSCTPAGGTGCSAGGSW